MDGIQILKNKKISLLITGYNNNIYKIGLEPKIYSNFTLPMGIAVKNGHFVAAERKKTIKDENGNDLLTIKRCEQIHEIVYINNDIFVSDTATNTIYCNDKKYWDFLSKENTHVNGLCVKDGKIKYATAFTESIAWRNIQKISKSGIVIDIESNEIICRNLHKPHSPRWYENKLWVLNSGEGQIGHVENGEFKCLSTLQGFTRGLAFKDEYIFVGLSEARSHTDVIFLERKSGVCVLDYQGNILDLIRIPGATEIFDVQVI